MLTTLTRHAPSFLPPKTMTPHLTGNYLEGGPDCLQQVPPNPFSLLLSLNPDQPQALRTPSRSG